MNEEQRLYPHEATEEHTPTPRDVYDHFVANPDMYHPGLTPHMERFFQAHMQNEKSVGKIAITGTNAILTSRDINEHFSEKHNVESAYRELQVGTPTVEQIKLLIENSYVKDIVEYGAITMSEEEFVDYVDATGHMDELLGIHRIYNSYLLAALVAQGYGEHVIDRCLAQNELPLVIVGAIDGAGLIDTFTAKLEATPTEMPLEELIAAYDGWRRPEYIIDNAEKLISMPLSLGSSAMREVLKRLISNGKELTARSIASNLIENGQYSAIRADVLVDLGLEDLVVKNIKRFMFLPSSIAGKLYEKHPQELITYYTDHGLEVPSELLDLFIKNGHSEIIASQIKFGYNGKFDADLAEKLIEDGYVTEVANNIDKFMSISPAAANALVNNHVEKLCQHITRVERIWFAEAGVLEDIIPYLSNNDLIWTVCSFWENIEAPTKELIEYVIEETKANPDVMRSITLRLSSAVGLDAESAIIFVKYNRPDAVSSHLDLFSGVTIDSLTRMAIEYGSVNMPFLISVSVHEYEDENLLQQSIDLMMKDPEKSAQLLYLEEKDFERFNINKEELFTMAIEAKPAETLIILQRRYDDSFSSYLRPVHLYAALKDGWYIKASPWSRSDVLSMFGDINGDEFVRVLRSLGKTNTWIMDELSRVPNLHMSHEMYDELVGDIETTGISIVLGMLSRCEVEGLDRQALFEKIKKAAPPYIIGKYLNAFKGCTLPAEYAHALQGEFSDQVLHNIELFEGLDHSQIVLNEIAAENIYLVIDYLYKLKSLRPEIAEVLVKNGCSISDIVQNMNSFEGINDADIANLAVDAGQYRAIVENENLQREVIANMRANGVIPYCEKSLPDLDSEEYAALIELMKKLPAQDRPEVIMKVDELMGSFGNGQVVADLRELTEKNHITENFQRMGINKTGAEGVRQIEAVAHQFIHEIHSANLSAETERMLGESLLLRKIFSSATRYDSSQWGEHSDESLVRLLDHRRLSIERDEIAPMPEEYEPSKVYEIETIEADKEKVVWTEDTVSRYLVLRDELINASHERAVTGASISSRLSDLRAKVRLQIEAMQEEIVNPIVSENQQFKDDEARHKYIENKTKNLAHRASQLLSWLESVEADNGENGRRFVLNSPNAFETAFKTLEPYKDLHADMRKIVFSWAIRKNPELRVKVASLHENPDVESISTLRDVIDEVVNDSVYKEYFTDKKTANKFKLLSSTRALEEALARHQEMAQKTDTRPVQFMPTRGFMLEVSGHMADACWATKYDSIAKERPNMSAVVIKDQPGTEREKIVGSALLIESTDARTGQPVLILRGNNPIENWINKRSVDGYFTALTDYVKETANRRGMRAAVVIDDHSGGSCSNRPALFQYCRDMALGANGQQKLEKVIVSGADTNFNGYDIQHNTYLIPA